MRRHLPAFMIWCACAVACAAQPAADPLLGEASAVLRINDLRWIERQLTAYAATAGSDPVALRATLARVLFQARSLNGIDLARPALLAWRGGRAPLLAVIPLSDRRLFLEDFGAVSAIGAPLVKVGERNGTVVYTQNTDAGLDEYRLLVQDDTAYLARTVDECRLLAARPPRLATSAAPLTLRATSAFLSQPPALSPGLLRLLPTAPPLAGRLDGMAGWVIAGWPEIVEQIAVVSAEVGPGADGALRLQGRLEAKADTVLAGWAATQKNSASRLLPLVRGADTLLAIYGHFDWQGQLDRLGQRLTPAARTRLADAWTPQVEESWRGQWEIADRSGPFALAIDLVDRGGRRGIAVRELRDQPRAQELVGLARLLAQAGITGAADVEAITAGGLSGFRLVRAGLPERITLADDRRQLTVESDGDDALALATALVASLERPLPAPAGGLAVIAAQLNLTAMARDAYPPLEGGALALPQVDLVVGIRSTPQGALVGECDLPLQRIAVLLREAAAGRPTR